MIGYYSKNESRDGKCRTLKFGVNRPDNKNYGRTSYIALREWAKDKNMHFKGLRMVRSNTGRKVMKPLYQLFALVFSSLLIVSPSVFGAPGEPDPTFGQNGRVFTRIAISDYRYFYPQTESMLVQPDGKVLVTGRFWEDGVAAHYGTFMARYMPDGSLDQSFGVDGRVATVEYAPGFASAGSDAALQPDGKILLMGQSPEGFSVRRYTSSGVLDTTFGNAGTAVVSATAYEEGYSIAIQPDGKILGAGGDYDYFSNYRAAILFRLNADGSVDTSFGSAGTGLITIENGTWGSKVFTQADGKIRFAGNFYAAGQNRITLARFNTDGTPDVTFGSGGFISHKVGQGESDMSSSVLQPNGKLVIAGRNFGVPGGQGYVARFNADGSQDMYFGAEGVLNYSSFAAETVLIQADGKIVLTGSGIDNGVRGFAVMRLTPDGSLDTTFSGDGFAVFTMNAGGTNDPDSSDGAIQADGKILLTGYFGYYYTDSHENIALLRIDAEPPNVTISGRVTTPGGQPLRNAIVTLADANGTRRTATTGSLGFYSFSNVPPGQSYTAAVVSRRYRFAPRTITADGNLTNIDFVGLE